MFLFNLTHILYDVACAKIQTFAVLLLQAVKNAMGSVFFNKGENCIAAGRIFVEETIYTEFLNR